MAIELARVREAARRRLERRARRRIAAQREHVLDAGARQIVEQRSQFGAIRADAGHVRDDGQTDLLLNLLCKRNRARARRAAGAVGDRDEGRAQRLRAPRSWRRAVREPASSFGGKNSNEKNGRCVASASLMRMSSAYRKLAATPPQSSAQPSTITNKQQLHRQRDDRRAEHHHAQPHQHRGNRQVDRDERQIEREADRKCVAQLADDEGRDDHA